MEQLIRLISLQDANTRNVLIGATSFGAAAAMIGSFAMLRRRALLGDAMAHAALPGICAAYFVVGERNLSAFLAGALLFGILAAMFVGFVRSQTRIKEDAAIAMSIGGFFGVGIVLSRIIQNRPEGNRAGLDSFIFGKAASLVAADARLILIVSTGLLVLLVALFKELKLLCFDRDFAATQGWPAGLLDLLLMALVCICTVAGLPAVGVVLVVALMVIPAAAARYWTDRLGTMVAIAGLLGGASGLLGTMLSATIPAPAGTLSRGWPTGPLIVLAAAGAFVISLLFAPRRGIVADLARQSRLRRRITIQNLLRDAFETIESGRQPGTSWDASLLARPQSRRPATVRRAIRAGLIARTADGRFALTAAGQTAAAEVVRAHRLWEHFLIQQANIAADHVDRDADVIEHVLPVGVLDALERRLTETGDPRSIDPGAVPASPHPSRPDSGSRTGA